MNRRGAVTFISCGLFTSLAAACGSSTAGSGTPKAANSTSTQPRPVRTGSTGAGSRSDDTAQVPESSSSSPSGFPSSFTSPSSSGLKPGKPVVYKDGSWDLLGHDGVLYRVNKDNSWTGTRGSGSVGYYESVEPDGSWKYLDQNGPDSIRTYEVQADGSWVEDRKYRESKTIYRVDASGHITREGDDDLKFGQIDTMGKRLDKYMWPEDGNTAKLVEPVEPAHGKNTRDFKKTDSIVEY